jgi:hypothetical protein
MHGLYVVYGRRGRCRWLQRRRWWEKEGGDACMHEREEILLLLCCSRWMWLGVSMSKYDIAGGRGIDTLLYHRMDHDQ